MGHALFDGADAEVCLDSCEGGSQWRPCPGPRRGAIFARALGLARPATALTSSYRQVLRRECCIMGAKIQVNASSRYRGRTLFSCQCRTAAFQAPRRRKPHLVEMASGIGLIHHGSRTCLMYLNCTRQEMTVSILWGPFACGASTTALLCCGAAPTGRHHSILAGSPDAAAGSHEHAVRDRDARGRGQGCRGRGFRRGTRGLPADIKTKGGYSIDCNTQGAHMSGPPQIGPAIWQFFQDHPFGVGTPYGPAQPSVSPSYCETGPRLSVGGVP